MTNLKKNLQKAILRNFSESYWKILLKRENQNIEFPYHNKQFSCGLAQQGLITVAMSSPCINDKSKKFQPSFLLFLFANWSLNPKKLAVCCFLFGHILSYINRGVIFKSLPIIPQRFVT